MYNLSNASEVEDSSHLAIDLYVVTLSKCYIPTLIFVNHDESETKSNT